MLRRWRREVAPGLADAEEAGTQRPASQLAAKLASLGITLRKPDPMPPSRIRDVSRASLTIFHSNEEDQRIMENTAPSHRPSTPEAALALSVGAASRPNEQPTQEHKKQRVMSFAEVMKFGAWMNASRLEGYYTKVDFCEHAGRVLGFVVSSAALTQWLESNNTEMPRRPQPQRQKTKQELEAEAVNNDIAAIALAVTESIPDGPHRNLLLSIVERRTAAHG